MVDRNAETCPPQEQPQSRRKPELNSQANSATREVETEQRRKIRHDLRTPLNQIIGYSEMLQEEADAQDLSDFSSDLKKIETAGRKLVQLLDDHFDGAAPVRSDTAIPRGGSLRPAHSSRLPSRQSGPRERNRGRILVVDDEPLNRDLIARRLRHHGYTVELADGGNQAIERIESGGFDLVVLDVMMPEVSGLDVLKSVRTRHEPADLPIIMATARDASSDVVEALSLGANDYVTKPLDFSVVLARIESQLGLKHARTKIRELSARLDAAQNRIATFADSAGEDTDFASSLARSIAKEIGEALGRACVVIWLFRDEALRNVTGGELLLPSKAELSVIRSEGRMYREREVLLAVAGQTGKLFGVLAIEPNEELFGESQEHLVSNFARHLGSTLELGEMRQELARTAEQRQATERDLLARGVDLLHLCPVCNRCFPQDIPVCPVDGTGVHATARPFPLRVAQRYKLERLVGEGGMGTVFRAQDERLGRQVALKLVKGEHFHNETVRTRFQNEARAVARIDHPGVIAIFDSGEAEDGSLFMVMEWLEGNDLGQVLDEQGPGAPEQVAELLRQVGGALAAAHDQGLVHRDVKPDNIFVSRAATGLQFKVLDFGVAKELNSNTNLTETGSMIGTPLYMSPEQLMNRPVDARTDTYSLAAVAYEALTGRQTVNGEQFAEVILAVATEDAPRLSHVLPGVAEELDNAFASGLSKQVQERPNKVDQWVAGFVHLLQALPPIGEWEI